MPSISQVRRNTWKQRSIELGGSVGFLNTHCYAKALQLSQRCEWVQKAVLCGRILSQEEGLDVFSFSTISLLEFWNDCFFCFAVRFSMYSSCSCYSMLLLFQFFFLRFSHRLHWLRFSISQSWQIEQHMSSCVFDNDYEVNASNSVDEFVKWLVKFCWNAEEWPHPGAPLRDPCLSSEYADSGLGELEPRYKEP